jgi:hypothetical protein
MIEIVSFVIAELNESNNYDLIDNQVVATYCGIKDMPCNYLLRLGYISDRQNCDFLEPLDSRGIEWLRRNHIFEENIKSRFIEHPFPGLVLHPRSVCVKHIDVSGWIRLRELNNSLVGDKTFSYRLSSVLPEFKLYSVYTGVLDLTVPVYI